MLGISASSAQAVTLTPSSRFTLGGPAQVTGAQWLSGGQRALCLGSRLVVLDRQGQVQRLMPTGGECRGLVVSPSGLYAATVQATVQGAPAEQVQVWNLETGEGVTRIPAQQALGKIGFTASHSLLVGGPGGVREYAPGDSEGALRRSGAVAALHLSGSGEYAVLADQAADGRARLQLADSATLTSLSALLCSAACPVDGAWFSGDGRTAVVMAGSTLSALRAGYPSSTLLRGAAQASGLPLRNGTVLTLHGGAVESRDLLTGRRERTLLDAGIQSQPLDFSDTGRVLALTIKGELLDTDSTLQDRHSVQLPAVVADGGLDMPSGAVLGRLLDGTAQSVLASQPTRITPVAGTYWALQTRNKATWALISDGEGGLALALLTGQTLRRLPSSGSHTRLSVNHWGNHAATWNDDELRVVSQVTGKLSATFLPPAGLLQDAQVTLSPDATRAFIFPKAAEPYVVTLQNGKRSPLPFAAARPGTRYTGVQISGLGVLAVGDTARAVNLYRPNVRTPFASVPGEIAQARFSNDQRWLALPAVDERGPKVTLVNAATGQVEATTPPLAEAPTFLTWSADSQRLLVGASLLSELSSLTMFEVKP